MEKFYVIVFKKDYETLYWTDRGFAEYLPFTQDDKEEMESSLAGFQISDSTYAIPESELEQKKRACLAFVNEFMYDHNGSLEVMLYDDYLNKYPPFVKD